MDKLDGIFAATEGQFSNSEFYIEVEIPDILNMKYERKMMSTHSDNWEPDGEWHFSCIGLTQKVYGKGVKKVKLPALAVSVI